MNGSRDTRIIARINRGQSIKLKNKNIMILIISSTNKTISIHCADCKNEEKQFHLIGVPDVIKEAIDNLGLTYTELTEEPFGIAINKDGSFRLLEQEPRTNVECKVSELGIGEVFLHVLDGRTFTYQGDNKGFYNPAWGKETVEFNPDDVVKPYMNIPRQQLKVKLLRIDTGHCMEIWQSESVPAKNPKINRLLYFGRDTADGSWSYLSDAPNGYCEPSHQAGPHLTLMVCDSKWNELFHSGNNKLLYPESFPTLEKVCKTEWEKIKDKYPNTVNNGLRTWLDTMKPERLERSDDLNWDRLCTIPDPDNLLEDGRIATHEILGDFKTGKLHSFQWLGADYHIIRYAYRHTKCDAYWYEYMVVSMEKGKVTDNVHWLAYELDVKPE